MQTTGTEAALTQLAERFAQFNDRGAVLYAVGGYVRNPLLGLPVSDIDICSELLPEEVITLCEQNGYSYAPKGIDYGTVEIHVCAESQTLAIEHTTLRSDTYLPDCGHRPCSVEFTKFVEKDACRRDFRMNAVYKNLLTGEIIDPLGGIDDIKNRIIKTTSDDPTRILNDDGLRILRLVRLACELGLDIDRATFDAAKSSVCLLSKIAKERVRDELFKILLCDVKYRDDQCATGEVERIESEPVIRALMLLREMDVFSVILPELEDGRGVEQKKRYHMYDVEEHMLHTCAFTPPLLHMRLAGLLHDIGKPAAQRANEGKNMHGHDRIGAELARIALSRLRCTNEMTNRVCRIVSLHMYDIAGIAKESTLKVRFAQWGERLTCDLIAFRFADIMGSGNLSKSTQSFTRFCEIYAAMKADNAPFSIYELHISGREIMSILNVGSSRAVGDIKRELLSACALDPSKNERNTLTELVRAMASK